VRLHPESNSTLHEAMGKDKRVKIEDGYEALPAYLPPPERRGLVLVDPPFEEGTAARKLDFERMAKAARKSVKQPPQGVYIFWRPIKAPAQCWSSMRSRNRAYRVGCVAPEKLLVADLWMRAIGEGKLSGPAW
jgi:23S rRNA (adenine2030-N6)-methyltransferase